MIITDCTGVESLTRIKQEFDSIGKEIWGVDNFCTLEMGVSTDQWGTAMIE